MPTNENLGPAERIIETLLSNAGHLYHGRPGLVTTRPRAPFPTWELATHKVEGAETVVYKKVRVGKREHKEKVGALRAGPERKVFNGGAAAVGEYRKPGVMPEVAAYLYRQVAEVWKVDNEFLARWASYAFLREEHRDLKVVLAAFLLCQTRRGDPLRDGDQTFRDADYRAVGEAMLLLTKSDVKARREYAPLWQVKDKDGKEREEPLTFDAKMLLRVHEVLTLPGVAAINRELGFGRSARTPFLGRWRDAATAWLRFREQNPKALGGLVKSGQRTAVTNLAHLCGYKPEDEAFFQALRWKQKQAKDGRRSIAIGKAVKAAETWAGKSEEEVCQLIVKERPGWKRLTSLLPKGLTKAIVAAAIEAGSLSDKDLVILTPTLEEMGLLEDCGVRARWEAAVKQADDTRAANIARNVRTEAVKEKLQEGADAALQSAVAAVVAERDLLVLVVVDRSGSMEHSIVRAREILGKLVQAFPLDHLHVVAFNTVGRRIKIERASKAGVDAAFRGLSATGGTSHGQAFMALRDTPPKADQDVVAIIIGDEAESGGGTFEPAVTASGMCPMAFGLVKLPGEDGSSVQRTATKLGIPCFMVDEKIFDDAYAVPRTLRALVASTPVTQVAARPAAKPRETMIEAVLKAPLLQKPSWV